MDVATSIPSREVAISPEISSDSVGRFEPSTTRLNKRSIIKISYTYRLPTEFQFLSL